MDPEIIKGAYHEAGHVLMAYYVSLPIESIRLLIENNLLTRGVTKYDFSNIDQHDPSNRFRRIVCLLGGPLSQNIYEGVQIIDLDKLGEDGISIDSILNTMPPSDRSSFELQGLIGSISNKLISSNYTRARQAISSKLISDHYIGQPDLNNLFDSFNLEQLQ